MRFAVIALSAIVVASCTGPVPDPGEAPAPRQSARFSGETPTVRLTGVVEAVRSSRIVVPQLSGSANRLTLTRLVPNGAVVTAGDSVARFDAIEQLTLAREAAAEFDRLSHQVREKEAENRANVERRLSALEEAEAELAKALLEVSKAEILSEVDAEKNALRAERARLHVESLDRSHAAHDAADLAALRILELQRDRQRVAVERAEANIDRLEVRAPLAGMVAHAVTFRGGSMARPQEGDQLYRNSALLSIFDPSEMRVRSEVGEPDGAFLVPGVEATVYIDAYPDLALRAHFESASPIASSALGSPIKTFTAIFRLDESDPRLMPDLSAAVVLDNPESQRTGGAAR
jgi:multidrug resistance efflux pump